MADEFDVEAMLEAPFRQEDSSKTGNGLEEDSKSSKKKDKRRSRSRSKGRRRSRSRSRGKSSRSRRSRSRSKGRRRSRSRERGGFGGRSHYGRRGGYSGRFGGRDDRYKSPDRTAIKKSPSPQKKKDEPDASTRDARTVFVMQLSQRVRERDLKEFFISVGKVRDCKIITDRNSRRSKGVGYVEFDSEASVPLALGLNNQRLMGAPIIVQPSHSEKNRQAAAQQSLQKGNAGPMRIYVGSLHFNINEDMLKGIFEPFGKIENIQLIRDTETGRSKGYGFITFSEAEEAKRALDQLNGFELAGRLIKVGNVTERSDNPQDVALLDSDELERTGIGMTQTGRLQLMAKLAEGTNFEIPRATAEALHPMQQVPGMTVPGMDPTAAALAAAAAADPATLQASLMLAQQQAQQAAQQQTTTAVPQTTTPCFMLSNMFDPTRETSPTWADEIRDDVIAECTQHGGVLHIHVDEASPEGRVYIKCPTVEVALASVNSLHGRWFAGKMITAAFVPLSNYHDIFPASMAATQSLQPRT